MMKGRTLLKLKKAVALACCTVAMGSLFGSACTMSDFSNNVVAGTLGAVKQYTQSFWLTLVPNLTDAINALNNAGIQVPNPPWNP